MSFEEIKSAIKDRVDLSARVARHTKLVKDARGYKACCPLPGHKEKTPSFHVNTRENFFFCYGCQRGGDIFSFVELVEGLPFMEAMEEFAAQLGYELPKKQGFDRAASEKQKKETSSGQDLLQRAANFYNGVLAAHVSKGAKEAWDYLIGRKIPESEIAELGLGWAPEAFETLATKVRGASAEAVKPALAMGLLREKNGRVYDFFRERLMIPIRDHRGKVVAFSGRTLQPVTGENPKYKNSPESEWFKKKTVLYGLDRATSLIREHGFVCVVEGYFDQWALHRNGIPAVAVMGTALSPEHLAVLGRHCKKIIMILDADEAGVKATARSLPLLLANDFTAQVYSGFAGKDPDDWLRANTIETAALKKELLTAREALEWWSRILIARGQGANLNRLEVLKSLGEAWSLARSQAHRNVLADEIAPLLGLNAQQIKESLDEIARAMPREKTGSLAAQASAVSSAHAMGPEAAQMPRAAAPRPRLPTAISPVDRAARKAFDFWMQHWDALDPSDRPGWTERKAPFAGTFLQKFVDEMASAALDGAQRLPSSLLQEWVEKAGSDPLLRETFLRALVPGEEVAADDASKIRNSFNELLEILRVVRVRAELQRKQAELRPLATEPEAAARLLQQIQELRMSLEKRK